MLKQMTGPRALQRYSRTRMPVLPRKVFRSQNSFSTGVPPPSNPNTDTDTTGNSTSTNSTNDNTPTTPLEAVNRIHALHTSNFAAPTLASLNYFRRALAYALTGIAGLALTTALAFEGAHQWVEHVELAPHNPNKEGEKEEERWGWTVASERWTGAWEEGRGGTDPALGWKARHAVRGAWIALHWGVGSGIGDSSTRTGATAVRSAKPGGGVEAVDARLELAHDFLGVALRLALQKQLQEGGKGGGGLRERTIPELLLRHADVLERMGGRAFLLDARAEYERVWASSVGLTKKSEGSTIGKDDAARLAAKLGDLNARLGDREEALAWWERACTLLESPSTPSSSSPPTPKPSFSLPATLPSSPLSQRTLASLIPSLSAHFVGIGDLEGARRVQEAGLSLLSERDSNGGIIISTTTTSKTGEGNRTKSPAEILHELYLAHRASLLSIHLAEVTYALSESNKNKKAKKDVGDDAGLQPLDRLRDAALSSERIANAITGTSSHSSPSHSSPPSSPESILLLPPPTPDKPLSSSYAGSRVLKQPATSLLRDARRAAVEAWTLAGILYESQPPPPTSPSSSSSSSLFSSRPSPSPTSNSQSDSNSASPASSALECYTRALAWAGVGSESEGGRAGEGTLEKEWDALWRRYVRVREVVRGERRGVKELKERAAAPTLTGTKV